MNSCEKNKFVELQHMDAASDVGNSHLKMQQNPR
jgi:hypothetical protein